MKSLIFFLSLLVVNSYYAFGQADEKGAIIKVIEDEHRYISERNFEKVSATFDHSESLLWGNGLDWAVKGWDPLAKLYKEYFTNNPDPQEPQEFYNYDITIAGDRAWAVFDKKDKGGSKAVTKELRILVKRDGEWKIASLLFMGL